MTNDSIKNIDINQVQNVDEELKPVLKEFLDKYAENMENYEGTENDQNKLKRLVEKIQTDGINLSLRKEEECQHFKENPYVHGCFNNDTKEVIIKNEESKKHLRGVVFHELTHYVNGFDELAQNERVQYNWLDEGLTEETSANIASLKPIAYPSYINAINYILSKTYGEKAAEYKKKIMQIHLYGDRKEIDKYIPEHVQYNLQGMYNKIEKEYISFPQDRFTTKNQLIKKMLPMECGKMILKNKSESMKKSKEKYNYEKRHDTYKENLKELEGNLSSDDMERLVRKQILRDFTDKHKSKIISTKKGQISSLLKNIANNKISIEDYNTPEGKTDILMEIQRIKSYSYDGVLKESLMHSQNDIIQGLQIDYADVNMLQNQKIEVSTSIKPKSAYITGYAKGEEYIYSTSLTPENYIDEKLEIYSNGNISKTATNKNSKIEKSYNVDTLEGKKEFSKKITEETKNMTDLKVETMRRKEKAVAEIDKSLDEYFIKYIGKDFNEVLEKSRKKKKEETKLLPEAVKINESVQNLVGMTEASIEKNPELFASNLISNFKDTRINKEDNFTEKNNINKSNQKNNEDAKHER